MIVLANAEVVVESEAEEVASELRLKAEVGHSDDRRAAMRILNFLVKSLRYKLAVLEAPKHELIVEEDLEVSKVLRVFVSI